MKNIIIVFSILFLASCTSKTVSDNANSGNDADEKTEVTPPDTPNPGGVPQQNVFEKLSVADFKARIEQKGEEAVIVDVRTPKEVAGGAIPNAVNIDYYNQNFRDEIAKLDKNKPTFLYCRSGGRSGQAMSILKEMGFSELYDLEGGFNAWSNQ